METLPIQSRQEFNQLVGQVGEYVQSWIQQELKNIKFRKLVFVEKNSAHYKINDMTLYYRDQFWVVEKNQEVLHSFVDKSSAIFYCLLWYNNNIQQASVLVNLNQSLANRINDCDFLAKRIKKYHSDLTKKEIALARYVENVEQINILSQQLKKFLINAKYIKFRKIL